MSHSFFSFDATVVNTYIYMIRIHHYTYYVAQREHQLQVLHTYERRSLAFAVQYIDRDDVVAYYCAIRITVTSDSTTTYSDIKEYLSCQNRTSEQQNNSICFSIATTTTT
jgi:hypothetical protein